MAKEKDAPATSPDSDKVDASTGDVLDDQIWDIWRLESPSLVCHFRGAPHVHAYINVARRA